MSLIDRAYSLLKKESNILTEGTTWDDLKFSPFKYTNRGSYGLTRPKNYTVHHKITGRSGDVVGVHEKGLNIKWHDGNQSPTTDNPEGEYLRAGDDFAWGEYELRHRGNLLKVKNPLKRESAGLVKESHSDVLKSYGYISNKKIPGYYEHPNGSSVSVYTHPSLGKVFNHNPNLGEESGPNLINSLNDHLSDYHLKVKKESLDLNEAHSHEDIANNPPKFVPIHHHDVWKALVLRDKHTNYGSAVNHYKRHMFKHGTVGATKMAKVSLGQSMTAESKSLISRAKGLLGITELEDNPLDSKVADSSDKLNHSGKKTTMGLIRPIVRKYRAFGGVNHSALKNDAKSHSASSRLSSK